LRQNDNRVGTQYVLMVGRLDRCYLKGELGDMFVAGYNLRKILNKIRLFWPKIIVSLMENFIKPERLAILKLG